MVAGAAPARYSRAVDAQAGVRMARKKRLKIALIGYGAISQTLFDVFAETLDQLCRIGSAYESKPDLVL